MRTIIQFVTIVVGAMLLGCGSDATLPPPVQEPAELYWDLELDHYAVTLSTASPYDTLTLHATPRNYRGEALAGLPAPTYVSQEISNVGVSPEGKLIGLSPTTTPIRVVASMTVGNLRHDALVFVQVVEDPNPIMLDELSIHPLPPDSAKIGNGRTALAYDTLPLRVTGADGMPYRQIPVDFRSSDSTVVRFRPHPFFGGQGIVEGGDYVGSATVIASATAFGISRADTLEYRIGWPVLFLANVSHGVHQGPLLVPPTITIGTGGIVGFYGLFLDAAPERSADVIFDDPTNVGMIGTSGPAFELLQTNPIMMAACSFVAGACSGGNLVIDQQTFMAIRHFPVAGEYPFRSVQGQFSGKIIVVDER